MKKLLLLLFILSFGYGQTRTSIMQLPQWSAGDTLRAGTKNERNLSNFGLNNGFARLDYIMGLQMDSAGYFRSLYGLGTQDFNIGARGSHAYRIIFNDSIQAQYNALFDQNVLVSGNINVGGYIEGDSILLGSGVIVADNIYPKGNLIVQGYGSVDTMYLGGGGVRGRLEVAGVGAFADNAVVRYDGTSAVTLTLPERTGILATEQGNDSLDATGKVKSASHLELVNITANVANPASNTSGQFFVWMNGADYFFVIKFNDGGTVRYKYLQLSGTSATWQQGTSLP